MEKKKGNKVFLIIELIIIALVLGAFIALLVIENVSPDTEVGKWVKQNVWDTESAIAGFNSHFNLCCCNLCSM